MKLAECELESVTPYSQSKYYKTEKLKGELPVDYEARTWRDRCHVNEQGFIVIPPMVFTNAIKEAAKFLGKQIPGRGKETYTKHFEAGILVADPIVLPVKKADVQGEWLFVPSDGKRGGGRRVEKCFPLILSWQGKAVFHIFDDIITEDVFREVLETAGALIGIGRFRPRNWGYYGRFKVKSVTWIDK